MNHQKKGIEITKEGIQQSEKKASSLSSAEKEVWKLTGSRFPVTQEGLDQYRELLQKYVPENKKILSIEEYSVFLLDMISVIHQRRDEISGPLPSITNSNGFSGLILNYLNDLSKAENPSAQRELRNRCLNSIRKMLPLQADYDFLTTGSLITSSPVTNGIPAHWHRNAYFDLVYIFSGSCVVYFRDGEIHLSPGQVLLIPPNVEHGEMVPLDGGVSITSAIRRETFRSAFLDAFSENHLLHSLFLRILNGDESIAWIWFRGDRTDIKAELDQLFLSLMREEKETPPYHNEMSQALMRMIFITLLRNDEKSIVLPKNSLIKWKPDYIPVFRYVDQNFRTVTLRELSEKFHYSTRQLIRIFHEATGQSFAGLLQERKMDRARDLLGGTSLPVAVVAEDCGYESASSFTRAFCSRYHMSPKTFRKKMQSDKPILYK